MFFRRRTSLYLKKYLHRIKHVHLKDIRQEVVDRVKQQDLSFLQAVKEGAFTVPGDGVIEFDEVFTTLAASDYNGWFVVEAEQDPALANPFEYALKARNFIKEKAVFNFYCKRFYAFYMFMKGKEEMK